MMTTATAQDAGVATPEAPAERPPELASLDMFMGKWLAEGESFPAAPVPGPLRSEDTFEWFPGEFFLVDRGEISINEGGPARHLWIMGFDPATRVYPFHAFDSQGNSRVYQATLHDRIWSLKGEWERATIAFSENGNLYTARWEFTHDRSHWLPLCELTATRVG